MKRLLYVLPNLSSYILPLIEGMANHCKVDVIYSPVSQKSGFGIPDLPGLQNIQWLERPTKELFKRKNFGKYQFGVVSHVLMMRPDAVLIPSNGNYINYWVLLILCKFLGIKVFSRGHGLIKKKNPGWQYRIGYSLMVNLSAKYICYTPTVKESLLSLAINEKKLEVDYNFQYNKFPLASENKSGNEKDILFIGRLRDDSGIEYLIRAVESLRGDFKNVCLHIIGGGKHSDYVIRIAKEKAWIKYHGQLFKDEEIREITKLCRFSCVAGSAGLSVVHMMSFSLPMVTYLDMHKPQGPETSYIIDDVNGWFYGHFLDENALSEKIKQVYSLPCDIVNQVQQKAWETYLALSTPPFHERLLRIMGIMD